jgi:hypothetical protein
MSGENDEGGEISLLLLAHDALLRAILMPVGSCAFDSWTPGGKPQLAHRQRSDHGS